MARQWQTPSGSYVNETGAARQWQMPDGSFVNQAADAAGSVSFTGAAPVQSLSHAGAFTPATVSVTLSGAAPVQSLGHAGTFTPTTGGTITSEPLYNNVDQLLSLEPLAFVAVHNVITNVLVVRVTGLSTNALGIFTLTHASIVPGTNYRVDWETVAGQRCMPVKAAT